ncbi:MAG: endoglucanase, partial [Nocardioidaceae bacterium]|nr:endoglucanase [Nocardioidaceae bacterium]
MSPARILSVLASTTALVAATALTVDPVAGAPTQPAHTDSHAVPAQLRVDQLGYLPHERKQARLMTARPVHGVSFVVVDARDRVVLRQQVPPRPVGRWSARYHAVYRLSFTTINRPGRYRLETRGGAVNATSPPFRVAGAGRLYGKLLRYGVRFDQTQRDGRHVISGSLPRKPSHLLDRRAAVYAWPRMQPGSDLILDKNLRRISGGPVNVAGGWF